MQKKYLVAFLLTSALFLGWCLNKKATPTTTKQTTQVEQSNTGNQIQQKKQNQAQSQIKNEFGDLTPFIKADLTTWEKEKLLNLLDERTTIKSEIGDLENYEGDKIIKLREIKQKRERLKQKLLPYIDPKKTEEFNQYCNKLWEKVQNKYIQQTQVPQIPWYSLEEVATHNKPWEDCRTIINGAVYDITSWFQAHPGGAEALNPLCWTDWTELFIQKHWSNPKAIAKLESFRIGIVRN